MSSGTKSFDPIEIEIEMTDNPSLVESKTAPPHRAESVEVEIRDSLVEEVEPDRRSARSAIVQKIRDQQQRYSGLQANNISAKREERKRIANTSAARAKSVLNDFWQGHRNMRIQGKPQGHHSTNSEEKKRHEAAYSLFLKQKFTPDVALTGPGADKPHVSFVFTSRCFLKRIRKLLFFRLLTFFSFFFLRVNSSAVCAHVSDKRYDLPDWWKISNRWTMITPSFLTRAQALKVPLASCGSTIKDIPLIHCVAPTLDRINYFIVDVVLKRGRDLILQITAWALCYGLNT